MTRDAAKALNSEPERGVIVDPTNGEILPDNLQTLLEREAEIDQQLRSKAPLYGFRDELRRRIAELQGPAVLPARRFRSERQVRVSVCPRCGEKTSGDASG